MTNPFEKDVNRKAKWMEKGRQNRKKEEEEERKKTATDENCLNLRQKWIIDNEDYAFVIFGRINK